MRPIKYRIAVIDFYDSRSPIYRDPILIPISLRAAGFDVELLTLCDCDSDEIHGFRVSKLSAFLSGEPTTGNLDCVIVISRFDPALSDVLKKIKARGVSLIVKGDTDGTLGYPIPPNYLRSVPLSAGWRNLLRHLKWRLPLKYFVGKRLRHIEYADKIVYESPGAGVNLAYLLSYWGLSDHMPKLEWIPNSVHHAYTSGTLPPKKNIKIVAVGRWNDELVKGADILIEVIHRALNATDSVTFTVIGCGVEKIQKKIRGPFTDKVDFVGQLELTELREKLLEAKIMLVPSRMESFSIASAEALCSGCSLVVTPIESLIYLSGGGAYGSVSRDFTSESLFAALLHEVQQWESGARRAQHISEHWREQLSQKQIGARWVGIVNKQMVSMSR
jgi:glycosyltransferase involved in cell wall biosynthesis